MLPNECAAQCNEQLALNLDHSMSLTDPAAPPAPFIQASSESVPLGQNLQVTCTVVGDQDVLVDFSWEYPGQTVSPKTATLYTY